MTDINFLQSGADVPHYASEVLKPRISLTSDVLDFRKCERKYGLYKVRNSTKCTDGRVRWNVRSPRIGDGMAICKTRPCPDQEELTEEMERIRNQLVNEEKRNPHSWNAVLKAGRQVIRMHLTCLPRTLRLMVRFRAEVPVARR